MTSKIIVDKAMLNPAQPAFLPCGSFISFPLKQNGIPPLDVDSILAQHQSDTSVPAKSNSSLLPVPITSSFTEAQIEEMLEYIDPDEQRDIWRNCIFAIRSTRLPHARQLAEDWSRKGTKFEQHEFDKLWNEGKERKDGSLITIKTLFYYAKQNGLNLHLGTDTDNARAFLFNYGANFIYSLALSTMFTWNMEKGCWIKDDELFFLDRCLTKFTQDHKKKAQEALNRDPTNSRAETDLKATKYLSKRANHDACKKFIKSEVACYQEFDSDGCLLNTPTGTVEITEQGWHLREFCQEDMLTKQTAVSPKKGVLPDLFLSVLKRALVSESVVEFVLSWFGANLLGLPKPHMVIFVGKGRDGKSLITTTVAKLLGDYAHTSKASVFNQSPRTQDGEAPEAQLMAIHNARFVVIPEISEVITLRTDLIKQITGGDNITARAPFAKHTSTFQAIAGLHMFGNSLPQLSKDQEGISLRRRIHIVQFSHSVSEEEDDPNLFERLPKEEGETILALLLDYAVKYLKNGRKLPNCEEIKTASDLYTIKTAPVLAWFNQCTRPRAHDEEGESFANLYSSYKNYTETIEEDIPISKNKLAHWLLGHGVKQRPSHKNSRRYDIALKQDMPNDSKDTDINELF